MERVDQEIVRVEPQLSLTIKWAILKIQINGGLRWLTVIMVKF